MVDKGSDLNRRVWTLFERAGFETKPNSYDETEETVILDSDRERTLDLSASIPELGVKIIGENTTATDLDEPFSTYVHDMQTLAKAAEANGCLFVMTGKEIRKQDRTYAKANRAMIWGEDELRYFEVVVDAIGEYAKYEIIHYFGITTAEETNIHNVLALRLHQPRSNSNADLYMFTITPDKLLKTCAIYRRAQGKADAYQRIVKRGRLDSVRKFVTKQNALLPPNIILHLGSNVVWQPLKIPKTNLAGEVITLARVYDYELGVLSIPMSYASMEIIDGQHRLYGFVKTEPATQQTYNLVVLGMKGLSTANRRDTFVAINANSRRVDPNLVAYLKYTENERACQKDNELMAIKIVVDLNNTTPFRGKIRLLDFGNQKITLKGFSGYDLIGLLGPKGLLRKHCNNKSSEYVSALRIYFSVLKSLFSTQWQQPGKYIIFTNRGISAFLKLLRSILRTTGKPLDNVTAEKYLKPLKENWKAKDWEIRNLKSAYVGSKGWIDFHRDLVAIIQKTYPEFKEK